MPRGGGRLTRLTQTPGAPRGRLSSGGSPDGRRRSCAALERGGMVSPLVLVQHIARPAVSEKRLSLLTNGDVRYELKTPYRDGTTHVIFEPLDFIAHLAALIPNRA